MRIGLAAAVICLSVVGLSAADDVKAAIRKDTSIPAGGLGPALQTLAKEYDFQVLYRTEVVGALRTAGAVGQFTSEEALKQLLKGTGLTYRYLDEKTITIQSMGSGTSGAGGTATAPGPSTLSAPGDAHTERTPASSTADLLAQVASGQNPSVGAPGRQVAAAPPPQPIQLEEVVVTAQKRQERALDVPISLVALTADDLQKHGITSVDDLPMAVPGLSIQSTGSQQRRIAIRGISNVAGNNNSSLIGVYLDEASVTSGPLIQLDLSTYDLERVEVLRGPQGTLFGAGSVGGTMRFITKNPLLDRFAFTSEIAASFTEDGAPSQRIDAALNLPLVADQLGLRVVGTFDHEGGWIDQPAADRKDYNEQNLSDVRVKGLWTPTREFSVNTTAVIHRNTASPNFGEDANGNYTQVFNLTTTPSNEDDYELYNLTLSYDFSTFRVLNTATYIDQRKVAKDLGLHSPLPPPLPALDILQQVQAVGSNVFNDEVRLTSTGSAAWQWTIGGFYQHSSFPISIPAVSFGLPIPPGTPVPPPIAVGNDTLSKSWAVFGDTSYRFGDHFTVGAGMRYFEDDQTYTNTAPGPTTIQSGKFTSPSPRAYLEYKWTEAVNTYVSAAKGFRSGGFNALSQPTYGPEHVWTYEIGTKTSLAGGRFAGDIALFYSNYSEYQVFGVPLGSAVPLPVTSNAGKARIKGAEWAFRWTPLEQWILSLDGDYIDSEFVELNATSTAFNVGDPLDNFPKYQFGGSAEHDFEWSGRTGFVRLDYYEQARETSTQRPLFFAQSDVIHMLNWSAGLRCSDHLSLRAFARNLLNDRGYLDPGYLEGNASRPRPRWYGVGFGLTF